MLSSFTLFAIQGVTQTFHSEGVVRRSNGVFGEWTVSRVTLRIADTQLLTCVWPFCGVARDTKPYFLWPSNIPSRYTVYSLVWTEIGYSSKSWDWLFHLTHSRSVQFPVCGSGEALATLGCCSSLVFLAALVTNQNIAVSSGICWHTDAAVECGWTVGLLPPLWSLEISHLLLSSSTLFMYQVT